MVQMCKRRGTLALVYYGTSEGNSLYLSNITESVSDPELFVSYSGIVCVWPIDYAQLEDSI